MSEQNINDAVSAMARHERPHQADLRRICEEIGYGRVMQLAEGWFEEKHPGRMAASDAVAAERHAARQPETPAAHDRAVRIAVLEEVGCMLTRTEDTTCDENWTKTREYDCPVCAKLRELNTAPPDGAG